MAFARKARVEPDGIQVWDGLGDLPPDLAKRLERRKNKLKTWPTGNWRFVAKFTNERGQEVRFCYSLHRNEAGYFFAWREVRVPLDSRPTRNPLCTVKSTEGGQDWLLRRYDVVGRRQKFRAKAYAKRKGDGWEALCAKNRAAKAEHLKREQERKAKIEAAKTAGRQAAQDLIGKSWPKRRKS